MCPSTWKDPDALLQNFSSPTLQCTVGALVGLASWPLVWQGWSSVLAIGGSVYVVSELNHYASTQRLEALVGTPVCEIVTNSLDKIRAATRKELGEYKAVALILPLEEEVSSRLPSDFEFPPNLLCGLLVGTATGFAVAT